MSDVDDLVRQAAEAFRNGQRQEARGLLEQAIELDQRHEIAWLWMSAVAETPEDQKICLENVILLNPNNQQARQRLNAINQQGAGQDAAASTSSPSVPDSSAAPPPVAPPPAGDSTPFDFAGTQAGSGADTGAGAVDDAEDWLSAAANQGADSEFDVFAAPATSMDWGPQAGAGVASYHGSGQQVDDMLTDDEYDDWMAGLGLRGGAAESAPPGAPASAPIDGGFDAFTQPDSPAEPFDSSDVFDSAPGAWDSPASDFMVDDTSLPVAGDAFGSLFVTDDDMPEATEELIFELEDEDSPPSTNWLDDGLAQLRADVSFDDDGSAESLPSVSQPPAQRVIGAPPATGATGAAGYYRYIPAEIQAAGGGYDLRSLALAGGIVLMLVLNVVSFAMLIL
ncbi:MAG: hypothetical protein JXQ72_00865 [Anaerolineae bacterium]|nr:hypothetical protein [Anaerolineae bacterium]